MDIQQTSLQPQPAAVHLAPNDLILEGIPSFHICIESISLFLRVSNSVLVSLNSFVSLLRTRNSIVCFQLQALRLNGMH